MDRLALWAGELPSAAEAGDALRNLTPVLLHMRGRAVSEVGGVEGRGSTGRLD